MEELDLRDYLNVIMARRWVIIRTALLVTIVALVWSVLQPPVYEGQAKLLIAETGSSSDIFSSLGLEISSQAERGLQTQVQLMQVRPLLENTIRTLELGVSPEALATRVEVTAVGQTNIVTVVARDGDAEQAAAIANTLAEEFVTWSREYRRESITAAAEEVETRLGVAKEEILDLYLNTVYFGSNAYGIEAAAETDRLAGIINDLAAAGKPAEAAARMQQRSAELQQLGELYDNDDLRRQSRQSRQGPREIALLRLYQVTNHEPYLKMARQFIEQRGRNPFFALSIIKQNANVARRDKFVKNQRSTFLASHPEFKLFKLPPGNKAVKPANITLRWISSALTGRYFQQHAPVRKQTVPVGHSAFGRFFCPDGFSHRGRLPAGWCRSHYLRCFMGCNPLVQPATGAFW